MTFDLFSALALFAFSMVITPGPNNLMLMASGANFGYLRSIPHMAGVGLGLPIMILPIGLGVMTLFEYWPFAQTILTVLSFAYILWLAWKIAHAAQPGDGQNGDAETGARPLTFLQAAAFQWINPKAWTTALSALTLYAPSREISAILWVSGTYVLVGIISTSTWTLAGREIRRLLTTQKRLAIFNWSMATLLVASMLLVFLR